MALVRIDDRVVCVLADTLFASTEPHRALAMLRRSEAEPPDTWTWARLLAVELTGGRRLTHPTEQDVREVAISVQCGASERAVREDAWALEAVVARVRKALEHQSASSGDHRLDTFEGAATEAALVGELDARAHVATLVVRAQACRTASETMDDAGTAA